MNETNRVVTELVVDGSQAVAGASAMESAFARAGVPVDQLQTKIDAVMSQQMRLAGNVPQSIDRVTVAFQKLQASTDPVLKAQFAMEREMTRSMAVINRAVMLGVTTEEQAAATIAQLRNKQIADLSRVREATAKVAPVAANQNRLSSGQLQGLGYQANDIVTMALMGAPLSQIAVSQGGQVLQSLQQNEQGVSGSLKAIGTGLLDFVVSPLGKIVTASALAVGAIAAFGSAGRDSVKSLSDAMKDHLDLLKQVQDSYKSIDNVARGTGAASQPIAAYQSQQAIAALRRSFGAGATGLDVSALGLTSDYDGNGKTTYNVSLADQKLGLQKPFEDFLASVKIGFPAIAKLNDELAIMGQSPEATKALRERIDQILELTKDVGDAQRAIEAYEKNFGPGGMLRGGSDFNQRDMQAYDRFKVEQDAAKRMQDRQYAAEIGAIGARSPSELAAAARARAEANTPFDTLNRKTVIERAGTLALAQATQQLVEAQKDRTRSLDQTLASARLDLSLIGQSTAATEAARMQYQLTSQVYEEAARNHVDVDQKEIEAIRAKAEAYGALKAIQQAAEATRSQIDNLSQLKLEATLIGQNATVRARALAQYGVELEIRKQGIALDSAEAQRQRDLASAISDTTAELARQADAWGIISDTAQSGIDRLVDSAANGFADIKDALNDVAKDLLKTSLQLSVANPLKNWLTGSDLPELGDLKHMGGALGRLFGRSPEDPASAVASAVAEHTTAMMTVTAAVVNITGGAGALGAPGVADMVGAAANDNLAAPLGKVTRAPLADIGAAASSAFPAAGFTAARTGNIPLAQIGAQGLVAKVNAAYADRFQGLLSDLTAAGYPIKSLGEGGFSDRVVKGTTHLSQHAYGEAIDINPSRFGNPMAPGAKGNWGQYGIDPNALAQKYGLEYGGNWRNADTMHFQIPRSADHLGKSLDHLATNSIPAVDHSLAGAMTSLKSFGGGLDALGKALSGGAGGPGGSLAGLFGSGVSLASMLAISPAATANIASGSWGLFDTGGYTGHGGRMDPAGIVHRGEYVFDAAATARIGIANLEAIRRAPGYADGGPVAMPRMQSPANSGGSQVNVVVNNAPAGTKTSERNRPGPGGVNIREIVVDIVSQGEADGEWDGIRASRLGVTPVRTVRGR